MPDNVTPLPLLSLDPYVGQWAQLEAAHLLRRTLFGFTAAQLNQALTDGLDLTVSNLLTIDSISDPINYETYDTVVPLGDTWINTPQPVDDTQAVKNSRNRSLSAWLVNRTIQKESFSIVEKMALFWQNHFACEDWSDPRANYDYLMLIRNNAIGNFKQLIIDMCYNPVMHRFLNGQTNTDNNPNENFAREFLELYTIGKGQQIGVGDYTNYTEQDVLAGSKIFSGWKIQNGNSTTTTNVFTEFQANLHDDTDKILSDKFGGVTVTANGENEYIDFINIVFQQEEVAKFICRKLFIWFVDNEITEEIETDIIAGLAETLINNNYEIQPVLEQLLKSQFFYDLNARGVYFKNPIEYVASIFKTTHSQITDTTLDLYYRTRTLVKVHYHLGNCGLSYFSPPSVAGWTAYYLEPAFTRNWINSPLIKTRFDFINLVTINNGISTSGQKFKVDALNFLTKLSAFVSVSDPVALIKQLELLFSCKPLSTEQFNGLKSTLTDGLPDFEWTVQYQEYEANPGNETFSDPVKNKIEQVLAQFFKMPEFHIQ